MFFNKLPGRPLRICTAVRDFAGLIHAKFTNDRQVGLRAKKFPMLDRHLRESPNPLYHPQGVPHKVKKRQYSELKQFTTL